MIHSECDWDVAVEKLAFPENRRNSRDRKCLPKQESPIVELPIATFFRPFSGEGVFQHPRDVYAN
jgi:hypothetical protein